MNHNSTGTRGELSAVTSTGTVIAPANDPTSGFANGVAVLIPSAGTYFFPLGGEQGPVPVECSNLALSLRWSQSLTGTATLEVTNLPKTVGGYNQGGPDVTDFLNDGVSWQPFNPAQSGALMATATGTGNSVTAFTYTLGGTGQGGASANLISNGFQRLRVKLVVTVPGYIRINCHGKNGS